MDTLLSAVVFGTNKLILKFIKTNFSTEDLKLIEKVLKSEVSQNIVGLTIPQTIDLQNINGNYTLRFLELAEQQFNA